jgi:lysophospholipase L1-like esterase
MLSTAIRAVVSAWIAVLSMPMLGEDLESAINQRVGQYNAALREIASAKSVAYLPLHETLVAGLPAGATPPPYRGRLLPMLTAIFRHLLLRTPWDAISAANGLTFLTDHVHLNERGAAVIADLIGGFLAEALVEPGQ